MYKHLFRPVLGAIGLMGMLSMGMVNAQEVNKDIIIQATATSTNQTLKINKYFANAYTVDRGDGSPVTNLTAAIGHKYATAGTYNITLSTTADRWVFTNNCNPLIPTNGTTITGVKITYMPSLESGFGNSSTAPGDYFFYCFNHGGALTSLPEGSFDTSHIRTIGDDFFSHFNRQGKVASLPMGSFNTSNITTVGGGFFEYFNAEGSLISLPEGSFKFSTGLTTVGDDFFRGFNSSQGKLRSLPEGSFDTSHITTVGNGFFSNFNRYGQLTSLPEGSFKFSTGLTTVGDDFFGSFNSRGQITSLPEGSFDTSHITTVGDDFFSFFNRQGKVASLPEGSFDTSHITSALEWFFSYFNVGGSITSLPDSFTMNSTGASVNMGYYNAFYSPGYTLNRKVSDLVAGLIAPSSDRDTFSDNQPGRCGVENNWLATTDDACHLIYDANGGVGTITGGYASNITGVTVGLDIVTPTRVGYLFGGWYTIPEGGTKAEIAIFPDMDGKSVYAHRNECEEGYTADYTSRICIIKGYNLEHNLKGGYIEDSEGNKYEGNLIINYVYDGNGDIYNPNITGNVKRENSEFIGWYAPDGEEVDIFNATGMNNNMIYAKYKCNFGYNENEEGSICEKIRVEFDANGGKFLGEVSVIQREISIIENSENVMKISHTPNLNDDETYNLGFGGYKYNNEVMLLNGSYFDEIIIEGATKLNLVLKYTGTPLCSTNQQCGSQININSGEYVINASDYPEYGVFNIVNLDIQGDSITISKPGTRYPNYGRYATITGISISEVLGYPDDAFDNIPQPTREGHKFVGWYLSDGTEFNTGSVSTGEVTYVYAKWECAQGYVDKQGQCVKEETKPSGGSSGGGGGGGGGGNSSSCKNLPANAVANNSSTPSSNTNYYYSTNTSKVCTFQCKSGYTRNEEKETCDKTLDNQTSTGTTVKEPEVSTGNNTKVETGSNAEIQTGNNTEIQTGNVIDSSEQVPQNDEQKTEDSSAKTPESKSNSTTSSTYSTEFQQAYEFAHENGITTKNTIESADMNGKLTRIAMAKMLSQYAMNVLGQKPANIVTPKFNDVTDKRDADYDNGVTLAYQLGIMGQNMANNFRPDDEVTRAEFATALSRMLYQTSDGEYKSTAKYYTNHLKKLKEEGIITKDDPKMKELRGYVMIMLMRSAK